jgi:hypothetical protein
MSLFVTYMKKYKKDSGKSSLVLLSNTQALWAIFVYRASFFFFKSKLLNIIKKLFFLLSISFRKKMVDNIKFSINFEGYGLLSLIFNKPQIER